MGTSCTTPDIGCGILGSAAVGFGFYSFIDII